MPLKNLCTILLLLIITLASSLAQAQPKEVTDAQMAEFIAAIENDAKKLREVLEQTEYRSDLDKQRTVEFTIDTFKIERMMQLRLSIDYSTAGMVNAGSDTEEEYDKILNKYYQLLLSRLNDKDKETLKQSQRNWIAFRDSEQQLNRLLTDESYSGGGTMQSLIAMSRSLELTKKRVFEIHQYLCRIY